MTVTAYSGLNLLPTAAQLNSCKPQNPNFSGSPAFPNQIRLKSSFLKVYSPAAIVSGSSHQVIARLSSQSHSPASVEEDAESTLEASSLRALLKSYKLAISEGDDKKEAEIENMICKEKEELTQKISALSSEVDSGKEKYIRLQADFENYRKRAEKERLNVRNNTQGEVIESLLVMVDSFERAKQQLTLETEKEKKIDSSYQGIYKQFVEIMRSLKVAAVPTIGKPFDPSRHEAISREESHEYKEGIVTQEFRRGFMIGDRLLRAAMVKVSAGPGPKDFSKQTSTESSGVNG